MVNFFTFVVFIIELFIPYIIKLTLNICNCNVCISCLTWDGSDINVLSIFMHCPSLPLIPHKLIDLVLKLIEPVSITCILAQIHTIDWCSNCCLSAIWTDKCLCSSSSLRLRLWLRLLLRRLFLFFFLISLLWLLLFLFF